MKYKSLLAGIVLGVLYGLIARLLFAMDPSNSYIETMSVAFLFGVPAVTGAITVCFGTPRQQASLLFRACMPWVTVLMLLLVAMVTLLEATVCIVILLPVFLISASFGGLIAGNLLKRRRENKLTLQVLLLLPFLLGPLESQLIAPSSVATTTTEVLVQADKATVWNNITSVSEIQPQELTWSFAHFIGIPKPIKSELAAEQVMSMRYITWEKEIRFRERITQLEPLHSFSYDILVDNIPAEAIDKHIEVGGKYFEVLRGGYVLTEIDKNTTKVSLHCTYRVSSRFNFYAIPWADLIMDDFQRVILQVVKARSENPYTAATATVTLYSSPSSAKL